MNFDDQETSMWQPLLIPGLITISCFCIILITSWWINCKRYWIIKQNPKQIASEDQRIFNVFNSAKTLWQIFAINLIFSFPALFVGFHLWLNWNQFSQTIWQGWSGFVLSLDGIIISLTLLITTFWLISALARQLIFETDWNVQNWAQRWWKRQVIKTVRQQNVHQQWEIYLTYLVANSTNWNHFWNLLMLTSLYDDHDIKQVFHLQWNFHRLQSDHKDYLPFIKTLMVQKLAGQIDLNDPQFAPYQFKYQSLIDFYLKNQSQVASIFQTIFLQIETDQKSDQYYAITTMHQQFLNAINAWFIKQRQVDLTTYRLMRYLNHQVSPIVQYGQFAKQAPYRNYFRHLETWIQTHFPTNDNFKIIQTGFQTQARIKFANYWYQYNFVYRWNEDHYFCARFNPQGQFIISPGFQHWIDHVKQWLQLNYHLVCGWKINHYQLSDLKTQLRQRLTNQLIVLFSTRLKIDPNDLIINRVQIRLHFGTKNHIDHHLNYQSWIKDVHFRQLIITIKCGMQHLLSPYQWKNHILDLTNQIDQIYQSYRHFGIWLNAPEAHLQLQQQLALN